MKNNQKHLDPEQAQELMNLGVEFGETADVWLRYPGKDDTPQNKEEWEYRRFSRTDMVVKNTNMETIPCPNLQEVLDVLPLSIKQRCLNGEQEVVSYILSIQRRFSISNKSDSAFVMEYVYSPDDPYEMCTLRCFSDTNPLIAAFNLLKWVAINYPESLIKK